ncbi:MAG TPA: hypothetical protein VKH46_13155 [Thermoanaerobaculia bacterium]|nr:hypothetical protein [Thermoanaerobaculia bacterium]
MASEPKSAIDADALLDEQKRLRRLRLIVDLTASVLSQEPSLSPEKGLEMIARAEKAIEGLFPGSHAQFELLVRPKLLRILEERFPPDPQTIN